MRSFEIILTACSAIRILLIPLKKELWHELISLTALGTMGVHLGFESYRWQMIPLYAVTLGMSIGALWRISTKKESDHPRLGLAKTIGIWCIFRPALAWGSLNFTGWPFPRIS